MAFGCSYNAHGDKIVFYLNTINSALGKVCRDYKNLILVSEFSVETEEKYKSEFMSIPNKNPR